LFRIAIVAPLRFAHLSRAFDEPAEQLLALEMDVNARSYKRDYLAAGLSISHVERRPAASLQRAARVRENVGNLACPALFDLGERARVVMPSVTEGDDKPLKYPHMFRAAEVVVITKSDLLPHVDFSIDRCLANVRAANRPCPFRYHPGKVSVPGTIG
jgi:hypothetical protein